MKTEAEIKEAASWLAIIKPIAAVLIITLATSCSPRVWSKTENDITVHHTGRGHHIEYITVKAK